MKNTYNYSPIVFILIIATIFCLFAACSNEAQVEGIALVVIYGKHANSNIFADEDYGKVRDLMKHSFVSQENYNALGNITVIISDGNPKKETILDQTGKILSLKIDANSARMREEAIKKRVEQGIMPYLRSEACRAQDEENDLLGAITEASLVINNNPGTENHIVILDSGIATAGYLNMLDIDIQIISNDEIIESLEAHGVIPDLSGINVSFLGLGNVAPPQEIRDPILRNKLIDLWTKIIESGGGALTEPIRFSPAGTVAIVHDESSDSYPFVSVVYFKDITIAIDSHEKDDVESVREAEVEAETETRPHMETGAEPNDVKDEVRINDFIKVGNEISSQMLGFKADTADYIDETEALRNLSECAATLETYFEKNPAGRVYIIGSEAKGSYGKDNTGYLSWMRADRVRRTLLDLMDDSSNVADNLISIGTGDKMPWRSEPEFTDGGDKRNEAVSEMNRAVWLIPETAEEKIMLLKEAGFIK